MSSQSREASPTREEIEVPHHQKPIHKSESATRLNHHRSHATHPRTHNSLFSTHCLTRRFSQTMDPHYPLLQLSSSKADIRMLSQFLRRQQDCSGLQHLHGPQKDLQCLLPLLSCILFPHIMHLPRITGTVLKYFLLDTSHPIPQIIWDI